MLRRSLALLALTALAGAAAPAALGALIYVRVEGKTRTIFGAAEPRALATTAFAALEAASVGGEFHYHVTQSSFGPYVDQIGRYAGSGAGGWVFKVNGVSPPVGADQVTLADGDRVLWYYAEFGPSGGPPTLRLARLPGGCYQAWAEDDAGQRTVADGAALRVDGRLVETTAGQACPGPHRGLVRAVRAGSVRSNALA